MSDLQNAIDGMQSAERLGVAESLRQCVLIPGTSAALASIWLALAMELDRATLREMQQRLRLLGDDA